jgi:hypothetical protein
MAAAIIITAIAGKSNVKNICWVMRGEYYIFSQHKVREIKNIGWCGK